MDDRVHLTAKVNGGHEIRIKETDLAELGKDGLTAELEARGFTADQLGTPEYKPHRMHWVIPVRGRSEE